MHEFLGLLQYCPGDNTPQNTNFTATYNLSRKLSKLNESDMWEIAGDVSTNS